MCTLYTEQYNVLIKYPNGPVSILYLEGLPAIRRAAAALYKYIHIYNRHLPHGPQISARFCILLCNNKYAVGGAIYI